MSRQLEAHTTDNITWIYGKPPENKLSAHSRALSQSNLKFSTSISKLKSDAKNATDFSETINDVLKEIQDPTQDLIKNIGDLKECIPKA
jgi:hypothetical protein